MSLINQQMPKTGKQALIVGMALILMTSLTTQWMGDGWNHSKKLSQQRSVFQKTDAPLRAMLSMENILQRPDGTELKKPARSIQKTPPVTHENPAKVVTQSQWAQVAHAAEIELPWLARIIHAEAGGESLKGQVAVGAVLINRIKSGRFPKTLKANIFRPGEFESVANGYIWSHPSSSSYQAARLALQGWDPTYGALYFFNPAKTNSRWIWGRPIHTVIGQHNFAG